MQLHSGKNSKAFVGTATASSELPILGWDVDPAADVVRFRNSKSGNATLVESTFYGCRFTITADFDTAANPYMPANGGLSITAGGTCAAILYINGTTSANWTFSSAVLTGNPMSVQVEGKPGLRFSFEANGTYVEPAT